MRSNRSKHIKIIIFIAAVILLTCVGAVIERFEGDPFTIEKIQVEENTIVDVSPTAEPQVLYEKININTADRELLCTLKGIGEVTADKIINYRTEHGDFGAIEEIMNVPGVGEKTFDRIKDAICVSTLP